MHGPTNERKKQLRNKVPSEIYSNNNQYRAISSVWYVAAQCVVDYVDKVKVVVVLYER